MIRSPIGLAASVCRTLLPFAAAPLSIVLGLSLLPAPASAVPDPDTTSSTVNVIKDTKPEFRATGSVTMIDRDVPPNHVISEIVTAGGGPWEFSFFLSMQSWKIPPGPEEDGAEKLLFDLSGKHWEGPHEPPANPYDGNPNYLPFVWTKQKNMPFG